MATATTPERSEERGLVPYEATGFTASRVLVLAPHPDDEVFGCGAAVASLLRQGARVEVLVLTDGAGWEADAARRREVCARRMAESRAALELLGGGSLANAGFEDRLLGDDLDAVAGAIADKLRGLAPDLVFAPSPVEVHPDHRATAEALLRALEGAGAPLAATARVAFYELSQPIRPNHLFDATEDLPRKDAAMAAFVSQNDGHDYPGYVRGLGSYRRMTLPLGVAAAEGYYVLSVAELARLSRPRLRRLMGPDPTPPPRASLGARLRFLFTGEAP